MCRHLISLYGLLGYAVLYRLRRSLGKQPDVIPRLDLIVTVKDVDLVLRVLAPDAIAQMPVAVEQAIPFPVRIERDDGLPEGGKVGIALLGGAHELRCGGRTSPASSWRRNYPASRG